VEFGTHVFLQEGFSSRANRRLLRATNPAGCSASIRVADPIRLPRRRRRRDRSGWAGWGISRGWEGHDTRPRGALALRRLTHEHTDGEPLGLGATWSKVLEKILGLQLQTRCAPDNAVEAAGCSSRGDYEKGEVVKDRARDPAVAGWAGIGHQSIRARDLLFLAGGEAVEAQGAQRPAPRRLVAERFLARDPQSWAGPSGIRNRALHRRRPDGATARSWLRDGVLEGESCRRETRPLCLPRPRASIRAAASPKRSARLTSAAWCIATSSRPNLFPEWRPRTREGARLSCCADIDATRAATRTGVMVREAVHGTDRSGERDITHDAEYSRGRLAAVSNAHRECRVHREHMSGGDATDHP